MRGRIAARVLRNSVLRGAAGRPAAAALTRGVQVAGQVGASANEFLRVRRDPAEVAVRRRRAAIRRVKIWGAGAGVGLAAGAALAVTAVADGLAVTAVFTMILVLALVIWCVVGLFRASADLRRRTRELAALPPPQPPRRAVTAALKVEIGRLDSYSDGLRKLTALLPADSAVTDLRTGVLTCADEAERVLRRQAERCTQVYSALHGAPATARAALQHSADEVAGTIRSGVAEYGRLVAAATETVAASGQLDAALTPLTEPTERLRALALGMREITVHAGTTDLSG